MPGMGGRRMVILRGLILYTVCAKACVYNPTTRQSVTLPAVNYKLFAQEDSWKRVRYFFGHDPDLDQYKVVCTVCIYKEREDNIEKITDSQHWVFVLEAGGSWKRIEFDQTHLPIGRSGVCINGVIYYIASTHAKIPEAIVSFNVKNEEFNMIQVPNVVKFSKRSSIIEYRGKPAVFDYTEFQIKGLMELWVLEDAVNWSRESLGLQPCQLDSIDYDLDVIVGGTTQDGEVLLAPKTMMPFPFYVLYYDLQKNHSRKIQMRGIPEHILTNSRDYVKLMDTSESIMHLQT